MLYWRARGRAYVNIELARYERPYTYRAAVTHVLKLRSFEVDTDAYG